MDDGNIRAKNRSSMSCDHAVWFPHKVLTSEEAGQVYLSLCEGDTSGVQAHPAIDSFYSELVAKHPQIDDVPDDQIGDPDISPWSCEFDRSPGHIILCCVWSKADYVGDLLRTLAKKHGLALYDPQSDLVYYPNDEHPSELPPTTAKKPWWKVW